MKNFIRLFMIAALLVACEYKKHDLKTQLAVDDKAVSDGGVDVGNFSSAIVPETKVSLTYPSSWKKLEQSRTLILQDQSGSKLTGELVAFKEFTDPSASDLKQLLKKQFPDRNYSDAAINGTPVLRADLAKTATSVKSDVFVVSSEDNKIVHLTMDLNNQNDGIINGEKIYNSVRILYKGEALKNTQVETVTLKYRTKYGYKDSILKLKQDPKSNTWGVGIEFGNCYEPVNCLAVGLAGNDSGRFNLLGSDKDVPFDQVKIDGKYLLAPNKVVGLDDIYTVFSDQKPMTSKETIDLKEGQVYLLRTISWPDEDLITKIHIDKLVSGDYVTLSYQKLAAVPASELQRQVNEMNQKTRDQEMIKDTGIVTLYSRYNWGDYVSATFNFHYSTRDNVYISRNRHDILYEGREDFSKFTVPTTWLGRGLVRDLGEKVLASITFADMPDPMDDVGRIDVNCIPGHTYVLTNLEDDYFVYGAFTVLEQDSQNRWVRLQWKRVADKKPFHFQKWTFLKIDDQKISSMTLNQNAKEEAAFYPSQDARGDKKADYYTQSVRLNGNYLSIDNRDFPTDSGFVKLAPNTDLKSVSLNMVEQYKGQFEGDVTGPKVGDIYLANLENFWEKSVFVMKVTAVDGENSLRFEYRRVYVGQTNPGHWSKP